MIRLFYKNSIVRELYARRTEIEKVLIISVLFSIMLVAGRIFITREWRYVFLTWNLFLGFIPYYISRFLVKNPEWVKTRWKLLLASLAWLLFIPNSFYILTDLFHLNLWENSPLWFDLTLILSFAWNGLMLGILSVRQMERIFIQFFPSRNEIIFLYPVMWLNALGIYVGRFMRFNSWDVITNPFELLSGIGNMIVHPFQNLYAWGMITTFSIFMTIIYICIKRIAQSL